MKLSSFKKALIGSVIAASLVAGMLVAATTSVAAACTETMLFTPASQTVTNGASTITVTLEANTDAATRGWGTDIHFDATKLQETNIAYGTTFYTSAYGTRYDNTATVNNTTGVISGLAQGMLGGTGGPTGTGTLVTVTFSALAAGNNSTTSITMVNPGLSDVNAQPLNPTTNTENLTIVTPPLPALPVSNVTVNVVHTGTVQATDPTTFNVSFQVNNIGTLAAGASTAYVTVNSGSPIPVATAAIAAGANSGILTSSTITYDGASDAIVVTADATNVVIESNESNNTASTSYYFSYPLAGQQTDVYGDIVGSLSFTQPATINLGSSLAIGPNTVNSTVNVISNQTWTITAQGLAQTVAGDANANVDAGKMTKKTGTTYNPYIKLQAQLAVGTNGGYLTPFQTGPSSYATPSNTSLNLTGTQQVLAIGIPQGQITSSNGLSSLGETRNLIFQQYVLASDPALASPAYYDIPVNFQATATAW